MRYKVSNTCQVKDLSLIYEKYFNNDIDKTFIEVGALDGESFSNTSCLADIGWNGYYIEPYPPAVHACSQRHSKNNVKVFNLGISATEGVVEFFFGGALTTSNPEMLDAYKQINWSSGSFANGQTFKCECVTLDSFISQQNIEKFDLLVVDVEGNEYDVFSSYSFAVKPKMIIAELEYNHPDFKDRDHIRNKMLETRTKILNNGYIEIYVDDINSIFVMEND